MGCTKHVGAAYEVGTTRATFPTDLVMINENRYQEEMGYENVFDERGTAKKVYCLYNCNDNDHGSCDARGYCSCAGSSEKKIS